MSKIAFVFPGQGAQYVGMMKDFYENQAQTKKIFDKSSEILNYNIAELMFNGPEEKLRQTIITQPAVFVSSVVCLEILKEKNPSIYEKAVIVSGHSLGEYSALYFAGAFDFEDGLKLVKKRAEFIHAASQNHSGTMAAVIGLAEDKLRELCKQSSGLIEMANFNTSTQIVVSGEKEAVIQFVNQINSQALAKCVLLNVSGAFHSSLMKEASQLMEPELQKVALHGLRVPVVTNFDAKQTVSANEIKEKLVKQINNPVLWFKTIENIIASGVDTFIEIGPGKVLSGLIRRINKAVKVHNVEDNSSLEKLREIG